MRGKHDRHTGRNSHGWSVFVIWEGKRKPKQVWIHYPLWVCERNVVVKEKTPFHTWMRQCRKSGNKKCGFSIRVNAMITDFFLFLYHQVGYLQVNNLSNL